MLLTSSESSRAVSRSVSGCAPRSGGPGRDREPGVGAPGRGVGETGAAAVRGGDRLDDRQAEAGAAAITTGALPDETAEAAFQHLSRESGPVVAHVELDHPALPRDLDPDLARGMGDAVLDEVGQGLIEAGRVGLGRPARRAGGYA